VADKEELQIVVRMKDFATRELGRLGGAIGGFGARTVKTFQGIASTIFSLKSAMIGLAAYFGARGLGRVVAYAGEIENIGRAFENLTKSADGSVETLEALRRGTKGTVDDFNLMKLANQAMLLGVAKTSVEFEELTVLARRLGQAVGRSTVEAFGDLATGIGRQSRLILDNLGIIVKVEKANQTYAARLGKTVSELTDAEKKQAFLNATLDAAREKVADLGEDAENLAGNFQKLKATVANLGQTFLRDLTPLLTDVVGGLATLVGEHRGELLSFMATIVEFGGSVATSMTRAAFAVTELLTSIGLLGKNLQIKGWSDRVNEWIGESVRKTLRGMGILGRQVEDMVHLEDDAAVAAADRARTLASILQTIEAQTGRAADRIREHAANARAAEWQGPIPLWEQWGGTLDQLLAADLEDFYGRLAAAEEKEFAILQKLNVARVKEIDQAIQAAQQWEIVFTAKGGASAELRAMADEARAFGLIAARSLRGAADVLTGGLVDAMDALISRTKSAKEAFSEMAISIVRDLARIAQQEAFGAIIKGLFSVVGGAVGGLFSAGAHAPGGGGLIPADSAFSLGGRVGAPYNIPGFQLGAYVRRGGLAYLHAGEEVVPQHRVRQASAPGALGGGGITVNVSVPSTTPLSERALVVRQAELIGQIVGKQVQSRLSTREAVRGRA